MTRRIRFLLAGLVGLFPVASGTWVAPAVAAPGRDAAARVPDFELDVLPWLQQRGCSSAKCHGGSGGKGGFALSLFGSDPDADHSAITVLDDGRRIDLFAPRESLLLQKPARLVRHGGGRRIDEGDAAWVALRAWIEAGAPRSGDQPGRYVGLRAVERDGGDLVAWARFVAPDGEEAEREVTDRVAWTTSDPAVAAVDDGRLVRHGPGEAFVFARFGSRSERVLRVSTPWPGGPDDGLPPDPGTAPAGTVLAGTVPAGTVRAFDAALLESLERLGLLGEARVRGGSAPTWRIARRLWIDLAGRPPRSDELDAFLAASREDPDAALRDAARRLVASDDFVEVWTERVAQWFGIERPAAVRVGPPRQRVVRQRAQVGDWLASGRPFLDLLDSTVALGGPWLSSMEDARDRAEAVARSALGIRIGCARCHDHPNDRWRQKDHLAFSALFPDRRPAAAGMAAARGGTAAGKLFDERGRVVRPSLLPLAQRAGHAGRDGGDGAGEDGPAAVRRWFREDDAARRQVARNLGNRAFAALFGRGLVEPTDDHRPTNPARHPETLERLADLVLDARFDLREVLRQLVTTDLYRRRSADADDAAHLADLFVVRPVRTLAPWIRRRAAFRALGLPAPPLAEAPASALASALSDLHGSSDAPSLLDAVEESGNLIDTLLLLQPDPDRRIDEVFRAVLTRPATGAERAALADAAPDGGRDPADEGAALRALAFALLNTREACFLR